MMQPQTSRARPKHSTRTAAAYGGGGRGAPSVYQHAGQGSRAW